MLVKTATIEYKIKDLNRIINKLENGNCQEIEAKLTISNETFYHVKLDRKLMIDMLEAQKLPLFTQLQKLEKEAKEKGEETYSHYINTHK